MARIGPVKKGGIGYCASPLSFCSLLKKSGWLSAAGWALHPLWDAGLHGYSTPFVPHWYIGGGIGFDLVVAAYVAFRERGSVVYPSAGRSRRI
jgi:hypothetical protein